MDRDTSTAAEGSVEELSTRIAELVGERQVLRASATGGDALEANRREIAALQQRLSEALIQRYLPAGT